MKRKEAEFTDVQYARIFTALSPDRKRQLLGYMTSDEVAIGEYKELKLPFIDVNIKKWADVEKSMAKTQFWIKMEGVNVQYPSGFIRKINGKKVVGNIFHRHGLICFYMDQTAGYAKVKDRRPASDRTLTNLWNQQYKLAQ